MKTLHWSMALLLIFIVGLYFGVLNSHDVQLRYYHGQMEAPLAVVVVIAALLGAVFGIIASLGVLMKAKREAARLRKTLSVTEKELMHLRSLPLKEKN